jgi:biopolymer transport protein TolQ
MDLVEFFPAVVGLPPMASVMLALKQSSIMGWSVLGILGIASVIAWTLMIGKTFELKRMRKLNQTLEQKLNPSTCSNLLSLTENSFGTHRSDYQAILLNALKSFYRFGPNYVEDDEEVFAQRMNHTESALRRSVAKHSEDYENRMVFLSVIVTVAPFIGLLGTVWGVMDAFGAIGQSGGGTIEDLAPGVSSALLTTVGGLLVAIPSVCGYNVLLDLVRKMTTEVENFASMIADRIELDWLKSKEEE